MIIQRMVVAAENINDGVASSSLSGAESLQCVKKLTIQKLAEKYHLIKVLGAGGNATVIEAVRCSSNEKVAVKVLRNCSAEKKSRFSEEIRILSEWGDRIKGLMPIYDYNEGSDGFWYEMPITEAAESILCKTEADDNDEVPVRTRVKKSVEIVRACAMTLMELHKRGISHRDIKPDNIHCLNGEIVLGDFGLVDIPESQELTQSDKALGAVFTMAPEMRRNPKIADGRKADVYSLAKTLWMFIKNDRYGFDGLYDWSDEKIGLHLLASPTQKLHLAELELLIHESTDNDPERRPTIDQFVKMLDLWSATEKDALKTQISEWDFLKFAIFGRCVPQVAVFEEYDTILKILRLLCHTPALNHTMFSFRGGLDLVGVEESTEEGCITLVFDHDRIVLKPNALQIGIFKESELNYFLIDAQPLATIPDVAENDGVQYLVEDVPGHYVSDKDAVYGVYDYDEGIPFPSGWHCVTRLTRGRLLVVSKSGPYNSIRQVYDGRHADCPLHIFQKYMKKIEGVIKRLTYAGFNWREVDLSKLCGLDKNPFRNKIVEAVHMDSKPHAPKTFLASNISKWSFLSCLEGINLPCNGDDNYSFSLTPDFFDSDAYVNLRGYKLSLNGKLYDEQVVSEKMFTTSKLSDARQVAKVLQKQYISYCEPYNCLNSAIDFSFKICIENIPNQEFKVSISDILNNAINADDRLYNRFVVDEDGRFYVLTGDDARNAHWYPVRMELFEPRKNNVGRYSKWPEKQVQSYYNGMYKAWISYCETRRFVFCDCIFT